jgi:hypothetical protein
MQKLKAKMDEQFGKFVEVIQKLYINIPLLDVIQVPTYVKYLKDILNNRRPLPTTKVIKLKEEYSAAILNTSPVKKGSMISHYRLFDREPELCECFMRYWSKC